MTEPEQPKRRPGRPPKYAGQGKRQNFNFRITEKMRERLIESVKQSGRSISEEIEFRLTRDLSWEENKGNIDKMLREASAIRDAAQVQAIRAAAVRILRETEGRPTRVIIDIETLLAEAGGLRPGFFAGESPPAPVAPRTMTPEQGERLMREWEEVKQSLKTEAAARTKSDDEAA